MSRLIFVNRYAWPDESATAQMLEDLSQDLAARGRRVLVIASAQRHDNARVVLSEREQHGAIEIVRVGGTRFGRAGLLGRAFDYVSFARAARAALRERVTSGDIVVAMTDPPMLGNWVHGVARKRGAHCVHWLQDVFPELVEALRPFPGAAMIARGLRGARDRAWRAADAVVCVGEAMRARVLARGVAPARAHTIANWADTSAISPIAPEQNALRTEWGLDGCFVVGYSGNFGRVHEFAGLLDAAERLRARADIRFVLIGAGAQHAAIAHALRARRLDHVQCRPFQPRAQLSASLGVADLHVVSQREDVEGLVLPSKIYGVLAAGRPVLFLGPASGEIARLLATHQCGERCAANDGAGIARAIEHIAADPARWKAYATHARAAALTQGSRAGATAAWDALLSRLEAM
jgi:glycosyltransferase involved in cell wall biosynthesis